MAMTTTAQFTDEVQVRSLVEVRKVDPEKRLIDVRLVPYEHEVDLLPGWSEVFTRGAFAAAVGNPSRCKISDQGHKLDTKIGVATELRDEEDGLYGVLRISDTAAGRDVLTLIRDDVLTQMSIEFKLDKHHDIPREDGGVLTRHDRAKLIGVSPVGEGAYGDEARVLAMRDASRDRARERALAKLRGLTSGPTRG